MALPTFVGTTGTFQGGLSGITVGWPVTSQAGDLGLLVLESDNEAISTPSGWSAVPNSPQGIGTPGDETATRLTVFYKYAESGSPASAVVADPGDHVVGRIAVFRGVDDTDPFNTSAGDTAGASTSVVIPGLTTTVNDCLIVALACCGRDTSSGTNWSSAANADLANVTIQANNTNTVGNGGGVVVITGEKVTAGSVTTTTVSQNTSLPQGRIALALQPPSGGGSPGDGGPIIVNFMH